MLVGHSFLVFANWKSVLKLGMTSTPPAKIAPPVTTWDPTEDFWVFGYGSLIWKVDFAYERRVVGYVTGVRRRFWQGSHDHRGTPTSPGRVVTLVDGTEYLREFAARDDTRSEHDHEQAERCWGVAYLIGRADVEEVIAHLDHREKNGYSSLRTTVFNAIDKPFATATVYIGTTDNAAFVGPAPLPSIAKTIVHNVGPSGRNIDYFINLCHAVRVISANHPDHHLLALEASVRRIAGAEGVDIHDLEEGALDELRRLVEAGVQGLFAPSQLQN